MTLTDPLARGLARLRLLPDPAERPLLELLREREDDFCPAAALFVPRRRADDNDYPDAA